MRRSAAARFRVTALELFERDVVLRMPFRFGIVTLVAAPQAFVRARIRTEDGREAQGAAAAAPPRKRARAQDEVAVAREV